jgi:hypothetical protein
MTRAMVLLKREFDRDRARRAQATAIHNQFVRDPLIRAKKEAGNTCMSADLSHKGGSII